MVRTRQAEAILYNPLLLKPGISPIVRVQIEETLSIPPLICIILAMTMDLVTLAGLS